RLGHDLWLRLGLLLNLRLGLGRRGLRRRLRLLRLRLGCLIALDEFVRHALWHARCALPGHRLALAPQPLFCVCKVRIHDGGRIEALATCKHESKRQRQDGESDMRETAHARSPQLLLGLAPNAISISTRERVPAGVCASVMIRSNQRLAATVSPAREAASTRNSRAV